MLTYKNTGIQKFILDRICQIHDEIVKDDPEQRKLKVNGILFGYWVALVGSGVGKIVV